MIFQNYDEMSLKKLRELARKKRIKGYYRMRKKELIGALYDSIKNLSDEDIKRIVNFLEENPRIGNLRRIAKMLGLKLKRKMKKADIAGMIREYISNKLVKQVEQTFSPYVGYREKVEVEKCEEEEFEKKYIPSSYNEDRLKALPVNPNWIHVYWDFSSKTYSKIKEKKLKLLVHDVTYIIFNGRNAHKTLEFGIHPNMRKYYVKVPTPRANYIAEIVVKEGNRRVVVMRSNVVETPPASPGFSEKEEWIELKSMKVRRIERRKPLVRSERSRVDSSEMVKRYE